jgi:hypothetical protein
LVLDLPALGTPNQFTRLATRETRLPSATSIYDFWKYVKNHFAFIFGIIRQYDYSIVLAVIIYSICRQSSGGK